jgi:zinc protease
LGQGKNSIFYKNFVKTQKAVNANAYNSTTELSGEFVLSVTPFAGQKLADMEKMLREALTEFEKRGVNDEDILKFRSQQEAAMINGLENVSGKVSRLAAYQTFTGDANFIGKDLKRYTSLTKQEVLNVYNKYIKGKAAVILSVLTKGNDDNLAAADNYSVSTTGYKAPDYGYNGLKYVKAKNDFDRSKVPAAGTNPVVTVPAYWKETIAGSISAIGTQADETPVVTFLLKLKGGRMLDANNPEKMGLASLFSSMMGEDTKNFTAEQFSDELDKLGSSIDVGAGDDATIVSVQCLKKNLKPTLSLLHERLMEPKFTAEALDRIKKRSIESIKNSMNRPNYVASTTYPKLLYGAGNVLGFIASGNEKTINAVSLKDIEEYFANNFSRKDAQLIVVGDVTQKEIVAGLGFLSELTLKEVTLPTIPNAPEITNTKIYFVDVAKAAQTEFRVGYVTNLKYDAMGDYFKTTVMNYPLGGAFNSRLNLDLREDKGWTYGARGNFDGDKYSGSYTFSAGIKADATDSALVDVMNILKEFHEGGIKTDELKFTQMSLGQSDARKYEALMQKAGFLGRLLDYNLNGDYTKMQNDVLTKLTLEDVNAIAKKYSPDINKLNILLVGDKSKCWDKLAKLGYEMVELDKEGNPISK